ncbi:hypothetical protein V7968_29100 [Nocardia vulneris]|uniref:hypothetical protein n=1 Tax=Nocardia vulneris TaxID=1141657 RepID=UPI0030CE9D10
MLYGGVHSSSGWVVTASDGEAVDAQDLAVLEVNVGLVELCVAAIRLVRGDRTVAVPDVLGTPRG